MKYIKSLYTIQDICEMSLGAEAGSSGFPRLGHSAVRQGSEKVHGLIYRTTEIRVESSIDLKFDTKNTE